MTIAIPAAQFTFARPAAPTGGFGDITNPGSWADNANNVPPLQFQNVPDNLNYPLNGDGRYWWQGNASGTSGQTGNITFIGDPDFYTGTAQLSWQVAQASTDGSNPVIQYSTDGGVTYTTVNVQQLQGEALISDSVSFSLTGCTGLIVGAYFTGGSPVEGSPLSQLAIAITRNSDSGPVWNQPDGLDPFNYNGFADDPGYDDLSTLQTRMLIRLGFSNQTSAPPPGVVAFITDQLQSAQNYLYRRYNQLRNKRLFRWKLNPLQRHYSLSDNDEDVLAGYGFDPSKTIDWVGVQDSRNVWYPLIEGIPPQLYTMLAKPWRPARYEIRQGIEVYPAPDQTYWLWIKGHFGIQSFVNPTDQTTIDSELVFLHALANAKAHYGQPDANNIESQANALRRELIAATHQSARYVPGTIPVPPAVRPTLIQFQDNQSG